MRRLKIFLLLLAVIIGLGACGGSATHPKPAPKPTVRLKPGPRRVTPPPNRVRYKPVKHKKGHDGPKLIAPPHVHVDVTRRAINVEKRLKAGAVVPGVGDILNASTGSWNGSPTGYAYQWEDCNSTGASCVNISGAIASSYTVASTDAGDTIRCKVTATNGTGSTTFAAGQTGVVLILNGLFVSGNQMISATGQVVHLHGVNRSGLEYQCIQGNGIFDGPSDAASIAAMVTWHVNYVRLGLNEDCWLGLNGVNAAYATTNYINAIVNYTNLLNSYGIYVELSLIWGAPGTASAGYQPNAPDEDHSPAMWQAMATTFKNNPNVILSPWGESYVQYGCLLNGCNNQATYGTGPWDGDATCGTGCYYYTSAGMQQAVTVMRGAGYNGPIAIPCTSAANTCANPSGGGAYAGGTWLTFIPTDPDKQIIAEAHIYGKNVVDTTAGLTTTISPILAAGYPVIFGETGETYDFSDCPSTSFISQFIPYAISNNVGFAAWTWDTWGACSTGALITDYDAGTANGPYGAYVESELQTFPVNP